MQYASALAQYKTEEFGGFDIDDVEKEISRGKKLKCTICKASSKSKEKSKGASCGCAVKSCRKTFHYPCAFNDPTAITKRLVVTMNKNSNKEKFVYYRVFCSKAHEEAFRKVLKDELRDGKSKRGRSSGDSNNNEGDGYSSQEGEAMTDTPVEPATSGLNSSYLRQSPSVNDSISLSPGQRLLLSFADNLAKRDTVATESPQNTEDNEANISPHDKKDRRKSGFVQPSRPLRSAARVSQPPSCSMIEEASNSNQSNRSMEQSTASEQSISPKTSVKMPQIEGVTLKAQAIVHRSETDTVRELEMNSSSLEVQTDGNQVCDVDPSPSSAVSPLDSVHNFLSDNASMDPANVSSSSDSSKNLRRSTRESIVLTLESATDGRKTRSSPSKYIIKSTGSPKKNQDSAAKVTPQSSPGNSPQKRQRPVRECALRNSSAEDAHTDSATDMDTSYESAECSVTDSSYKSVDSSVRLPLLKITDRKTDSTRSSKLNTSPGVDKINGAVTEQPDTSSVSASRDNSVDMSSQSRKRKASDLDVSHSSATSEIKSRRNESSDASAHATVVLIPSTMENFEDLESMVLEMASDVIQVKTGSLCVWQTITGQTLPSQLSLFFMLDLIKKAETGDTEALLKLLFNKAHLAAETSRYNEQASIFLSLSDPKAQEDVQKAFWAGLEKNIKTLPMVHLLRLPGQELVTLAIDVRHCNESQRFQAHLQAFKGLTRWNKSTKVSDFKPLPSDRSLAARAEIWMWQVWLTTICPVSQVTVLPSDTYLLDTDQHAEYQSFVQFLTNNINSPSAASKADHGSLLVFKHVDLNLLDFQAYFRKVCKDALEAKKSESSESKKPLSILSLVPLDNLDENSYKSVLSLIGNTNGKTSGYSVSVRSAFCPHSHLTKLVLLEITENQHATDTMVTEEQGVDKAQGKRRGRPKKLPVS